jgi:hypothetical protein
MFLTGELMVGGHYRRSVNGGVSSVALFRLGIDLKQQADRFLLSGCFLVQGVCGILLVPLMWSRF